MPGQNTGTSNTQSGHGKKKKNHKNTIA